jgi:hypothetical protein
MKQLTRIGVLAVLVAVLLIAGALPSYAQLSVSKSSIAFGSVAVGLTSKADSFYVRNSTQTGYAVYGITTKTSRFTVTGTPGTVTDSIKVRVTFTPDAVGAFTDTVTIVHSAPGAFLKVVLSGTGISGIVLASPRTGATLTTLTMVDTFATHVRVDSLTIRNVTGSAFTVSAMTIANKEFTVLTAVPFTINNADSARVKISYQGTSVGRDPDTLSITHNLAVAGSSPAKLPISARSISHIRFGLLTGTTRTRTYDNLDTLRVTAASAGTAGGKYDPFVPVDSARTALTSVWNPVDTVWVRVDSIRFTGPHFRILTPTPYTHRPGDAYDRNISFIYQPKDLSPVHRDTLVMWTNDNIPTGNRITLLVEGASRRATYLRSGGAGLTLNYGTVGLGVTVDSVMRIHNFQDIALRIDSIVLARKNPKYQIPAAGSSFTVNRGDTAKIVVRLTVTDTLSTNSSGNIMDTVLVYSDFGATPIRLPLTAKTISSIVYNPSVTAIGFGTLTVSLNLFKDSTIKVYNRTTTNYRIDSVSVFSGKDFYVLSNVLATQLKGGDSTAVQVRFRPLTAGFRTDTLYIWHNFAPAGVTNPTKFVLSGTGSTNALIDPVDYVTVDNVRGPDGYAVSSPDSSYVETTINGFYVNATVSDYGGIATGHRRSPNLSGSPNGSTARWTFKIDSTAPYLIYHYLTSSPNAGSGFYVHLRKFGVTGIVDSMRYDLQSNFSNILGAGGGPGTWFPLMMHRIDGVGPNAASITIGADALSSTFMRVDAVRFLRSRQKADIEFGRRAMDFSPIRVPEEYNQVTLGTEYVRPYRLYNLGRDTLVISDIKFYGTLTPVPWFSAKNFTGSAIKIPPMKVGSDGKETGGFFDLQVAFGPYQEGSARDSMVITSNDDNEPKAYNILYGDGVNYNFIMNASVGNTEPHYNAPGPPDVPKIPLYRETANGTWASSTRANAVFPNSLANANSRVNTGGVATLPHQAFYEFQLPEIAAGVINTAGRYLLEYGGPPGSPNGYSKTLVKVTHTFGVPVDSEYYNAQLIPTTVTWTQIGGTAKTFFLAPGGVITAEFARNAQTEAAGGNGLLRVDLLRVRKVPTGALIGVNVAPGASVNFGDVSFRQPAGVDGKANLKEISLASRGETQIVVRSIKFRDGRYFRLAGAPSLPLYMRALTGDQKLTLLFTPDRISPSFVDTLEILSNSVNRDSLLLVPMIGNGIGGIYTVDDDGAIQEVSSTPLFGGVYIGGWDKTKMNNWQVETSNVPDDIGKGKTRHLLPIYFNPRATFEWYPAIPLDPSIKGDSVLMNVAVTVPRGLAKGSPGARYRVFSTGGNLTKDTVVNQNNPPTTGASTLVEINLGNHWFLRGGRDVAGGQAFFGHVQLFNDTAAVSAYFGTTTNFARRDTFALLADAIILRELDRLQPSVTGVTADVPLEFALSQNYPNPFNPTTTIEFSLARTVPVELKIYDMLGREVAVLLQSNSVNPGRYLYRWDGRNRLGQPVATGVYFYRLVAGDFVKTSKMLLIK